MANRGNSRAAPAVAGGRTYEQTESDYFDEPAEGEGADDARGQGGEGGEGAEDAAFDAGSEQEIGGADDLDELDPEPEPQPRRAQTRIQNLARELAEEKRARQEMQQRLDRLTQPDQTRSTPGAFPPYDFSILREPDQEFNARVRQLPLEDQLEQRQLRSDAKAEYRLRQNAWQNAQQQDKTDFDAFAATNSTARKYAFKVEQERERLIREQGNYVPRREVLKWLIGGDVLERRSGAGDSQRAQRRVAAQTVRPGASPRGDVGQDRRAKNEREARAARLEGQRI